MSSRFLYRAAIGFFACFETFRDVFKRRGQRNREDVRRVIVPTQALFGDCVLLVPFIEQLIRRYPSAHITVAMRDTMAEFFRSRFPSITVVVWHERSFKTVLELLVLRDFDLAYIPWDERMNWVAKALGCRWIVGLGGNARQRRFLDEVHDWAPGTVTHNLLRLLKISDQRELLPHQSCDRSENSTSEGTKIVLNVGASMEHKQWPAQHWTSVANSLRGLGYEILWIAGSEQKAIIQACKPHESDLVFAGTLNPDQLLSLINESSLVISNDSAVGQLTKLSFTPTLVIFGPSSPHTHGVETWGNPRWQPIWQEGIPCRNQPVLYRRQLPWVERCTRSVEECSNPVCITGINPEHVIKLIKFELGIEGSECAAGPLPELDRAEATALPHPRSINLNGQ